MALEVDQRWSAPPPFINPNSFYLSGVQVADIDSDLQNETITIGNIQQVKNQPPLMSQIGIWRWTGSTMIREKLYNFTVPGASLETRSLAIWSFGGVRQIVTLGYFNRTGLNSAMLGIWSWDGATFTRNALWNWTSNTGSGTQGYAVAAADIEGGAPDIITVGSTNNGTATRSEVRVWGYSGSGNPLLKAPYVWVIAGQDSGASSVSVQDLLNNGKKEIIVGGQIFSYPFVKAEISVFQYSVSTSSLSLLADTYWQTNSQTSIDYIHVATGDVDNSGTGEIVSVGFSDQPVGTTDVFYGNIRIWSWTGSSITLQQSFQYSTVPTALYSATVADIDKIGKQDIVVGGQQVLKGMVEIRDVSFVDSTISLIANPSPALAGQSVAITGTLTNVTDQAPLPSAEVLLEYSSSGGAFQILATTSTDSQGRFGTSFTPAGPGSYTIRATWSGDGNHMGTSTNATLSVAKASSVIVLSASSFNIQPGSTERISGYLYPATMAILTVSYVPPTGTSIIHTLTSDNTGAFSDQAALDTAGSWNVTASWPGSATVASATSNVLSIGVNKTPSIIVLSTSTSNAQPGDTVTVSGYIYPGSSTSITITYTSPGGASGTHTVTSDSTGAFSDQYTIDSAGTWTIAASWGGSTTTASSKSNALSVQTQPQPLGVSLSLYSFIIGIAALGTAILAIGKKSRAKTPSVAIPKN